MIRGILFDMGGTLDGDGLHWLDRFVGLYRRAGVTLPRDVLRAAFDAAERRAASDEAIATAGLDQMIATHVAWQLEYLSSEAVEAAEPSDREYLSGSDLERHLVRGFVEPIREAAKTNRELLADLARRGFAMGVVSNGCGNVDVLCRDYGYAPFLSAIVDSRRVGVSKPDPRIFTQAASLLGTAPHETVVVGDSFDRDIVPAKRAGMLTVWLQPDLGEPTPDATVVDLRAASLAELAAWLPAPVSAP